MSSDRNNQERLQHNKEALEAAQKFQESQKQEQNKEEKQIQEKQFSLDFAQPTEFVDLPSKGYFYDEDSCLSDGTAEVRQMTANHEDILTDQRLLKQGIMTNRLVSSLMTEQFPITDMLTGDKNAIVINSRMTAYGSDYKIKTKCTFCGQPYKADYNLQEDVHYVHPVENSEVSFDRKNKTMTLTLPETGFDVVVRLMSVKDELKLNGPKKKGGNLLGNQNVTKSLKLLVKEVQGESSESKIHQFIDKMPAKDSRYLRMKYKEYNPNVHIKKTTICQNCGMDHELEVGLRPEFFWPTS